MSKKRDFSAVVWAFGWLLNLATLIKKHVDNLGVPFDAFAWLVSDKGELTLAKLVRILQEDYVINNLVGRVLYGRSVSELHGAYADELYNGIRDGQLVDAVIDMPSHGLYRVEFERRELRKGETVEIARQRLAGEGLRFATLAEALQLMIDGNHGRKVTNWEHIYAFGTVHENKHGVRYCYVHNNQDGMDYGSTGTAELGECAFYLVVRSSKLLNEDG